MRNCSFYGVLVLLLSIQSVRAQPTLPDSSYVRSYRELLNVSTGLQTNNVEFLVSYPANKLRFELVPRETLQQFILLQYRWINFRYSLTPGYLNPDRSSRTGASKRSSFELAFVLGDVDVTLGRQVAEGYFVRNTKDFVPGWKPGDAYLQLNTLRSRIYSLQLGYNSNKKFSDVGMVSGKSKQLKAAASFMPSFQMNLIDFTDASTQPSTGIQYGDHHTDLVVLLPVSGALVWAKDWSVAAAAGPVVGMNWLRSRSYDTALQTINTAGSYFSAGYYFKGGISYTRNRWYAGINAYYQKYAAGDRSERTSRIFYGAEFYIGTRLRAPGFLARLL
jgi:hypothetical protein